MIGTLLFRLDRAMRFIESTTIAVFSIIALFIGLMQVVLRYIFNTGFEWSEAIFIIFTVAGMLIAGSLGVRENAHVCVDIIPQMASPRIRNILLFISNVAALSLAAYFLYSGTLYVLFAKMMGSVSPDTGFKDWVIYSIIPLTMAGFCLRYLINILRMFLPAQETDEGAPKLHNIERSQL